MIKQNLEGKPCKRLLQAQFPNLYYKIYTWTIIAFANIKMIIVKLLRPIVSTTSFLLPCFLFFCKIVI